MPDPKDLTTVHHPTLPGVSYDVPDAAPWRAQGWLTQQADAPAAAEDKPRKPRRSRTAS